MVVLALVASPAMAGTGGAGDGTSAAANATTAKENSAGGATTPAPAAAGAGNQQQADHQATPPLIQVLQAKGILTAEEAKIVSQASSPEEANERLARLLVQKGLISTEDYSTAVASEAPASDTSSSGGHLLNALMHSRSNDSTGSSLFGNTGDGAADDQPLSIRYKGITLTPGGFLSGTTTYRQRATSSDSSTPFNAIPFSTANLGNISEFNTTARQSLISLLAEGKVGDTTLRGYYESDFNSAGTTSNNNSTNSYTLRVRQAWAQAALANGWTFTGGQMWSLVTADRHGVDPRNEIIPVTIDSAYTVGFNYARQEGFRISKSFGDHVWFAMSIEDPELNSVAGSACAATSCIYGVGGNATGLFNVVTTGVEQQTYSFNASPDFIFKLAFEPGFGHYEIFGLVDTFHERFFPCFNSTVLNPCANGATGPTSFGANNQTSPGGGIGVNAYWSLFNHKLDVNYTFMGGNGIGRYGGTTGFSDVVFNANNQIRALRDYRSYVGFILHPTSKLDIYAYAGLDELQRAYTYGRTAAGAPLALNEDCLIEPLPTNDITAGGACNAVTRYVVEGTVGFWYRFFRGTYGTLQAGMQYSYVDRDTWAGTITTVTTDGAPVRQGGTTTVSSFAPHAIDNLFFTSFRYYLP